MNQGGKDVKCIQRKGARLKSCGLLACFCMWTIAALWSEISGPWSEIRDFHPFVKQAKVMARGGPPPLGSWVQILHSTGLISHSSR